MYDIPNEPLFLKFVSGSRLMEVLSLEWSLKLNKKYGKPPSIPLTLNIIQHLTSWSRL